MDSCQLIRKQNKMEIVHFNQRQLVARWALSEATLERWRSEGIGPKFLKLCGRVLYRQVDITLLALLPLRRLTAPSGLA